MQIRRKLCLSWSLEVPSSSSNYCSGPWDGIISHIGDARLLPHWDSSWEIVIEPSRRHSQISQVTLITLFTFHWWKLSSLWELSHPWSHLIAKEIVECNLPGWLQYCYYERRESGFWWTAKILYHPLCGRLIAKWPWFFTSPCVHTLCNMTLEFFLSRDRVSFSISWICAGTLFALVNRIWYKWQSASPSLGFRRARVLSWTPVSTTKAVLDKLW